jgi:thiamine pyrophosphokinase
MTNRIVHAASAVTLVGGGPAPVSRLKRALTHAPYLVAADGGAGLALRAGRMPAAVIGDLDSLAPSDRARIPARRLFAIAEQDSTDFDKALRSIAAPLVLGVGFLGGRSDHLLAALSTLIRHPVPPCILLGEDEVIFHAPSIVNLDLAAGDVVSLFSLAPVRGRSQGLAWPIDGLELAPGARIGTSNRALGPVQLRVDGPGLLVILPGRALGAVIQAIAPACRSGTPAPGSAGGG